MIWTLWLVIVFAVAVMAATRRAATARRRRDAANPSQAVERVRALYDRGAFRYELAMEALDQLLFAAGRRWLSAQARGDVLELAAGSGRNRAYYSRETRLTAQDISRDAQALDFPDARFDTVVCTLGLCTIPDDRRAVLEAWRVLRAGGRLLLLEHVRSPYLAVRIVQRLLDALVCLLASDHLLRDPLPIIKQTGFEIERLERHTLGMIEWLVARKPLAPH